jgi:MoaA/NifB/PqqE/SkfB family radical SAM enzyme
MTLDEIKRGLDKIADFGILYLTMTGGEPMVRPDFWEICKYARHLGFALRLYTNGYLVDEERARSSRKSIPSRSRFRSTGPVRRATTS